MVQFIAKMAAMQDGGELTVAAEEIAVLLDSLPYIDTEYEDPAMQSEVRRLIEAEMQAMVPRDYLAHLPAPPELSYPENPVLASEVQAPRLYTSPHAARLCVSLSLPARPVFRSGAWSRVSAWRLSTWRGWDEHRTAARLLLA